MVYEEKVVDPNDGDGIVEASEGTITGHIKRIWGHNGAPPQDWFEDGGTMDQPPPADKGWSQDEFGVWKKERIAKEMVYQEKTIVDQPMEVSEATITGDTKRIWGHSG